MATYNGEKYIIEQLDSIRLQTQPPDEVIMCDDVSSDNTVQVVKSYIEEYGLDNWQIIENEKNLGYYDNFFKTIFMSRGDTIYLSDQDDVWDLNKIKTFEALYAEKPEAMMIQSNVKFIDSLGRPLRTREPYHLIPDTGELIKLPAESMCKHQGSGYTMSFRREVSDVIEKNSLDKLKEGHRFHDVLLGIAAIALGDCYLDQRIYDKHRLHDSNATRRSGTSSVSDRTKAKQLEIVTSRVQDFSTMLNYCTDDKREILEQFRDVAQKRKDLIERFSPRKFFRVAGVRKYYSSKLGVFTDLMYSLGLEKLLLFMYKHI